MSLPDHHLELLAPARDADIGIEAVNHGADAVYIGGPSFGARSSADNSVALGALKIVADGVNRLRSRERAVLVITHYQRLLDHLVPDRTHVLMGGRIVKSGDRSLALELEKHGYGWIESELAGAPPA